ncbi:MAG: alpha/beta fold hydrolase [Acidimicrobiales bacterium]
MDETVDGYVVEVGGAELQCQSVGAGPTLVWAHALTSSMEHEDRAPIFDWSGLARRQHRWVRYDARGHGRSGADDNGSHLEWPHLARDMVAVADGSDVDRFAAGGASMGCATALWCAHMAPERVDKLVLALPPTAWDSRRLQAAGYQLAGLAARLRLTLPLHLSHRFLPKGPSPATRSGYLRSTTVSMAAMAPPQVAAALGGAAASDLPPSESLELIGMPALILAWPGDRSHPVGVAQMLAETLGDATLDIAEDDDAISRWPDLVVDFLASG